MKKYQPKILYVEDDIDLSFVTKDNLELKGYDVTFCQDGKEALAVFNKSDFDLCILDVMLPKMDGFTLAKNIREVNEDIPIIFLTAKDKPEDQIKGVDYGAIDYIVKPFSIVFLQRKMCLSNNKYECISAYFLDKTKQRRRKSYKSQGF